MIRIILILFFILYSKILFAKNVNFTIGLSSIYTNINDPNFSFVNKYESLEKINFTTGITKNFDKIYIGLNTNRLGNSFYKRTVIYNKTGQIFQNKSRITADTLLVGYRYKRIIPAVVFSNVKLEKLLYYNNVLQAKKNNNTILFGLNLSYIINKNINSFIFYIMPNKELYLKNSFGFGINYIF